MKEFTTAVEEVVEEDKAPTHFKTDSKGEFILDENGDKIPDEKHVLFKLDGRVMHAYFPTDGQMAFMMAALGRGQSDDSRFASIIAIMMESLEGDDKDYLEGRLMTRDKKQRLGIKEINGIFEHVSSEWFARPTKSASDSAESSQTDGTR